MGNVGGFASALVWLDMTSRSKGFGAERLVHPASEMGEGRGIKRFEFEVRVWDALWRRTD